MWSRPVTCARSVSSVARLGLGRGLPPTGAAATGWAPRRTAVYRGWMRLIRTVVVLDAADVGVESSFWAGMLGGQVFEDEAFHSVIDSAGEWRIGVQLAPEHEPPNWPDGEQQVHLDLHVEDGRRAHERAVALGARLLRSGDLDSEEGHQVYADPAGHPFCIGWGHPSREELARFVRQRLGQQS